MDELKLHPIKLLNIQILELHLRINDLTKAFKPDEEGSRKFTFSSGFSEYNAENKIIAVGTKVEIGMSGEQHPFSMRVELVGEFQVNNETFPVEKIPHWAKHNAPILLIPYLREQVYSLSLRCGLNPVLLPLVEVPAFVNA